MSSSKTTGVSAVEVPICTGRERVGKHIWGRWNSNCQRLKPGARDLLNLDEGWRYEKVFVEGKEANPADWVG